MSDDNEVPAVFCVPVKTGSAILAFFESSVFRFTTSDISSPVIDAVVKSTPDWSTTSPAWVVFPPAVKDPVRTRDPDDKQPFV